MKINWKVRLKNKAFWVALIPALFLLVTQVCKVFGLSLDLSALQEQALGIVGTVFTLLALFGVVNDPTTSGTSDSEQALTYSEPKKSE
jgi:phi LC3 family holin